MSARLRLRIFPAALDDAEAIVRRLAHESPQSADRFQQALAGAFARLQKFPRTGTACTRHQSFFAEVRRYGPPRFRDYLIFYAVEPSDVVILRIAHGAGIVTLGSMPAGG